MKGDIYTEQRCFVCGGKLLHDDKRNGLFCAAHPQVCATGRFIVRFGRDVTRRFGSYALAAQFLSGLRYKTIEGTFDALDYKKDAPLGFMNLARKWLAVKQKVTKRKSFANLERYMEAAIDMWGQANVKTLGYAEIEDFLFSREDISDKTRANMRSCLHDFWNWLRKRRILRADQVPEMPEISFELGWRPIVDVSVQQAIIEEVGRICPNPKVHLGIRWLATYVSIRPGELLAVKEGQIDAKLKAIVIPHPKEKAPKVVYLLPEDITALERIPRGLPDLPFFRHQPKVSGVKAGRAFGEKYFWKWWKKACANLNVEGVDLYGGTRHSTVTALGRICTPEEVKDATGHASKAFQRYFQHRQARALVTSAKISRMQKGEQHPNNQDWPSDVVNLLNYK